MEGVFTELSPKEDMNKTTRAKIMQSSVAVKTQNKNPNPTNGTTRAFLFPSEEKESLSLSQIHPCPTGHRWAPRPRPRHSPNVLLTDYLAFAPTQK